MEYSKALLKLQRYCVYQDRCHQEVRTKLLDIKVFGDDLENIITDLINDDFLNEERFARSFARGKFRIKKWGRNKIRQALKIKNISDYCIKKGLSEIEEAEYFEVLGQILQKQMIKYDHLSKFLSSDKAIKYAHSRGYETPIIYKVLKNMTS